MEDFEKWEDDVIMTEPEEPLIDLTHEETNMDSMFLPQMTIEECYAYKSMSLKVLPMTGSSSWSKRNKASITAAKSWPDDKHDTPREGWIS